MSSHFSGGKNTVLHSTVRDLSRINSRLLSGIIQEWSLTMAPPPSPACSAHCPSPHCEHHLGPSVISLKRAPTLHTRTHKPITLPFKGPLHSGDRSSPLLPFHPSGFSNKRARPRRHRMAENLDSHPDTCFHNAYPPSRSLSPSSCTLTPPPVSLSVAVTQVERRPTGCGDSYFLFGVSASSWFLSF